VVVDAVGGQLRTDSLAVMAPMGRMLLVGNASGDWSHTVPTNTVWHRSIGVLGFSIGTFLPAHPELARPAAEAALRAVGEGLVDVRLHTLPLAEAAEAHRRIEGGQVGGRLVLVP
jgi:NADPH2:quinone reductase